MVPIKEALTFDDVTLAPNYSEILPSETDTSVSLTKNLKLKIPLLSSAMDTVTESKMAIAIAKAGGIGVIHRNLDIKTQVSEIRKVKKHSLKVGAAVGASDKEFNRAKAIINEGIDLIVVDTAHGHTKKVGEIIKYIKKNKNNKIALCAGNIATPEAAKFLIKLGHEVIIQSGAGDRARFSDKAYKASGCKILKSSSGIFKEADVIVKVNAPSKPEQSKFQKKQILISFVWPAQNKSLLENLNKKGVTSIAMDMVPRISRAQKMDALSSMSNIAGYRAVVEATSNFDRFLTGQITAAGKVPPAKVLVIGAGVAGLAAIGTSVSLGAIVRAFDVRPEVAEQIESMGAEFLMLEFEDGLDGSETGGYAAPSSPEFRKKQLQCFREQAAEVDIVITTALIPGMDAPKLWLKEFVDIMKPGSVIVDLAAE